MRTAFLFAATLALVLLVAFACLMAAALVLFGHYAAAAVLAFCALACFDGASEMGHLFGIRRDGGR